MGETSSWGSQLEWPQEVVGGLEMWTYCPYLVNQVLNAHDANVAQNLLHDGVAGQGDSLLIDLTITSLED